MTRWTLHHADCLDAMRAMDEASIDAIVTDPPYGLVQNKKGGSGTASVNLSTPHGRSRIGTGNGIGGFMGKAWDSCVPGVPFWAEALRVAKPGAHLVAFGGTRTYHRLACAIEDAGWEVRDCLSWLYGSGFPKSLDVSKAIDKAAGAELAVVGSKVTGKARTGEGWKGGQQEVPVTASATDAARRWEGWGTALKPAWEPVILARKPLGGTVAANVLAHGTGALNIDATRIGGSDGRWPANVALDEEAAALLDERTGGASRFFYTAKASRSERGSGNTHPTVKPLALMRWLVRMVTPPGGVVLDPFNGSGTTGVAALAEGMRYVGCEREAEYVEISRRRISESDAQVTL